VSTDNPVIVLIFLIYSLVLCWGNISNSNVTMKFAQLQYLSSQNVGGDKRYYVPPVQKLGGHVPHKLGPWLHALTQSDCFYSSLFFKHYNRSLLCEWV